MNNTSELSLGEFPHWKIATATILIIKIALIAPVSLFFDLSIVVAIFKTKCLRKPINLIHQSLLLGNTVVVVTDTITGTIFVPPLLRSCECSQSVSAVIYFLELLYIAYQPLNYACLGIFQLLIIKGKKRFVSYKTVCISMLVCAGITAIIVTEGITLLFVARQSYVCNGICPEQLAMPPKFPGIAIAQTSYALFSWGPSLVVVLVCTTWSCVIFKNNVIASSDELNRRIISLPVVLPITLVVPSLLSFAVYLVIEEILTVLEIDNLPYWILFGRVLVFQIHQVFSGIGYPCLLLHLNPQIQEYWKKLVVPRRRARLSGNQVLPIKTNESTMTISLGSNNVK